MKTDWTKTADATPPPNEWVIIYQPGDRIIGRKPLITIGSYEMHPGSVHPPFWIIGPTMRHEDDLTKVTHWTPLPAPPKEGESG